MSVRVEIEGDRIRLETRRYIKGLQENIPGAYFSKAGGKHWTLPLTVSTLVLLRQKFKSELEYGPNLRAWGWEKKQHAKLMHQISKMASFEDLDLIRKHFPRLYKAVTEGRPYQGPGAHFVEEGGRVIIADTVGLGKTAQTMAGILNSGVAGPHLVVTPKTSIETVWVPEIIFWSQGKQQVHSPPEGYDKRNYWLEYLRAPVPHPDEWWVVHPKMLTTRAYWVCKYREVPRKGEPCNVRTQIPANNKKVLDCGHDGRTIIENVHDFPHLFEAKWGSITVDEAHKSLLRRSSHPSTIRRGFELLQSTDDGLRIVQSATPWASRPYHLWSVLNWLYPEEYTAFWTWVYTYYDVEQIFQMREIKDLRPDRERLLYQDLSGILLRRTRAEVRNDLPPRMYVGTPYHLEDEHSPVATWIPMTAEQTRIYDEMQEDGTAFIEGGEVSAVGALAELTRLRQFANSSGIWTDQGFKPRLPSNKFDKVLEILETLGIPEEPQGKVVIVSQFTELIDLFAEELLKRGISNWKLTGSTSPKNRKKYIERFDRPIHEDSVCVLLLNTQVGGAAITLDEPEDMIILDETFEFDDQEQVEGRIDNRKPERKIATRRYHYLKSLDTVDVGIALANAEAKGTTHRILDGRRGVTFARRVIQLSATASRTSGVQ